MTLPSWAAFHPLHGVIRDVELLVDSVDPFGEETKQRIIAGNAQEVFGL